MTALAVQNIEEYAKLSVEEQMGKDIGNAKAELLGRLDKVTVSHGDLVMAVDYLTNVYGTLLTRQAQADSARFALLVRALEQNRVLSQDVLKSITDQLKAINDEEKSTQL